MLLMWKGTLLHNVSTFLLFTIETDRPWWMIFSLVRKRQRHINIVFYDWLANPEEAFSLAPQCISHLQPMKMWGMWNGGSLWWHLERVQLWLIFRKKLSEFHLTTASTLTVRSRLQQREKPLCTCKKKSSVVFEKRPQVFSPWLH